MSVLMSLSQILEPAAEIRSFAQLAVEEGFEPKRRNLSTVIVGIDARYVII